MPSAEISIACATFLTKGRFLNDVRHDLSLDLACGLATLPPRKGSKHVRTEHWACSLQALHMDPYAKKSHLPTCPNNSMEADRVWGLASPLLALAASEVACEASSASPR